MSINHVVIGGNLTKDAELMQTQSGKDILRFSVAVNEQRKNPNTGEYENYANFFDCVTFGNRAKALANILKKGLRVCVSGLLRYSSWEKDGQKRSKIEIIANDIDFMTARDKGVSNQPDYY